jgi:hypothetical protein
MLKQEKWISGTQVIDLTQVRMSRREEAGARGKETEI